MRLNIITELEQRLDEHARMDFAFLYSEATSLLSVGYNCDTNMPDKSHYDRKRAARTVLTGMCYSVGSATRQGSSSLTRFIGQSAMTSRT